MQVPNQKICIISRFANSLGYESAKRLSTRYEPTSASDDNLSMENLEDNAIDVYKIKRENRKKKAKYSM